MSKKNIITAAAFVIAVAIAVCGIFIAGGFGTEKTDVKNGAAGSISAVSETEESGQEGTEPVKIACVGDSITYGYGIAGRAENCYPALLQKALGEGYEVRNFGVSGTAVQKESDAPYWQLKKYTASVEYDADILIFMMGSNDANTYNWKGAEAYRTDLCAMLDSYMQGKKKPEVYLCTPACAFMPGAAAADIAEAGAGGADASGAGQTDSRVTNFDVQVDVIPVIGDVVREVAAARGYHLVDIYAVTAGHPEWFTRDGVHPDNDGAAAIAEAVYQAMTENIIWS